MSYYAASTANPLGFRPWNSRLNAYGSRRVSGLGSNPAFYALGRKKGLRGLGDTPTGGTVQPDGSTVYPDGTTAPSPSLTSVLELANPLTQYGNALRDINARINALVSAMQIDKAVGGNLAVTLGPQVVDLQNTYASALDQYLSVYFFVYGSDSPIPDGLQGLGAVVAIVAISAAVVAASTVAYLIYSMHAKLAIAEAQSAVQQKTAQNQGTLLQMAQTAQQAADDATARGDYVTASQQKALAQQYLQAAQSGSIAHPNPQAPFDITPYLPVIGIAAAAVVLMTFLVKR
jgi:hypothetical protein